MTRWLLAAVLLLVAGLSMAQAQERRVALVVGVDRYAELPALRNAVNDARAVAGALQAIGFEVVGGPLLNPDHDAFLGALDRFDTAMAGADLALFFFAGHGVQMGADNFLLPTNARRAGSPREVEARAVNASRVLADMQQRSRAAVMILDACRENPFARDATRGNRPVAGETRGLGSMNASPVAGRQGAIVLLAAEPGQVAYDRLNDQDRVPNGLLTRFLVPALREPGRPLSLMLGDVRDQVVQAARAAGRRQAPHIIDQLEGSGRIMFARGAIAVPAPLPVTPAPTPGVPQLCGGGRPCVRESAGIALPYDPATAEARAWQQIAQSRDAEEVQEFLRRFPLGDYAEAARVRLDALRWRGESASEIVRGPDRTYLVFFGFQGTEVSDHTTVFARRAAVAALVVDARRIELSGHADRAEGALPARGAHLSEVRAEAIAAIMIGRFGIPRDRLVIESFGDRRPLIPTAANVREPQNRRVEIVLR